MHIAISNEFISQPIVYGIEHYLEHPYHLHFHPVEQNVQLLLKNQVDLAFISLLDYAKNSSELELLPDMAIFSTRESRYALLFFQENLREINQVGFLQPETHYHTLCRLVFSEYFELSPTWVPVEWNDDLKGLLSKLPGLFLWGDPAMDNYLELPNHIDIVEEWISHTGQPYIHQVIAVHREFKKVEWLNYLYHSRELGIRNLMKIAKEYAGNHAAPFDFYFDLLNEVMQFYPDEHIWQAAREYFQFLFYYGYIEFLPELHFVEIPGIS